MPFRLLPMLCTVILAFLLAAKLMLADSCPAETERTRAKPETVDSLDCSFDQGLCKWKPENMQTTGNFVNKGLNIGHLNSTGKCLVVLYTNTMSSLKSELVEDTNGSTVCMEFAYIVTGVNAQLSVYTSPEGSTETRQLWSYLSVSYSNSSEWKFAAVPLRSCLAFQVVLKTLPTNDERAAIAIDNIKFRRNGGATCSGDGASEDSVNAGAIAGSVTAVIFVSIIALLIGIILWRRRFRFSSGGKHDMVEDGMPRKTHGDVAAEYNKLILHGNTHRHPQAPNSKDLYDHIVEAGAPGKALTGVADEYNVLSLQGNVQRHPQPQNSRDLYDHLDTVPSGKHQQQKVQELYRKVQKKPETPTSTHTFDVSGETVDENDLGDLNTASKGNTDKEENSP